MKNSVVFLVLLVLGSIVSCVSLDDREMNINERASTQVLGPVEAKFNSFQFFHVPAKNWLKQRAYTELMKSAKKEYEGDIDIRNIEITGNWSNLQLLNMSGYLTGLGMLISGAVMGSLEWKDGKGGFIYRREFWGLAGSGFGVVLLSGNTQKITATGDVVLLSGIRSSARVVTGIEGALKKAAEEVSENFTTRSRIAIVYITAQDRSSTEFITGELEHLLLKRGHTIIDRSELDKIRREQNFQMGGEIDDETAVSIGKFVGANIIVTGRVDGEGDLRRLRLRALDTTSAQVVGTASERL